MVRPKRIDLPFILYHVMSRTNSGDVSFTDDKEYIKFLHYLEKYTVLFSFRLHAWCLMPNHFHLLLESANQPALSELLRRLLTAYTIYFNRKNERHGHLFQGRFKSYVVDKAEYLLSLSRYIHRNPSSLSRSRDITSYKWSSLRYYIHGGEPQFLYTKEILNWFKGNRRKYEHFVLEDVVEETKMEITRQKYIGSQDFVRRMSKRIKQMREIGSRALNAEEKRRRHSQEEQEQAAQRILKLVSEYFSFPSERIRQVRFGRGGLREARTIAICLLRDCLPWTYREISDYMNLSDQSVIPYHEKCLRNSKDLSRHFEAIYNKFQKEIFKEFR